MNYTKLMSYNPTSYGKITNTKGQEIEFFEHPLLGDETFVICACHEIQSADYSPFFEIDDMTEEHKEYEPWFNEQNKLKIGEL